MSIVDFKSVEAEIGQIAAENVRDYVPADKRVPLPDGFQHVEGTSKVGRLAGEAMAREYLNAADACDKAGDAYLERQMLLAASHRTLADDIEADGRDKAAQYHEQAERIRQRGQIEFKRVEMAALHSDAIAKHIASLRQLEPPQETTTEAA